MTRFVPHATHVDGALNYAFDEGKDAGSYESPAKVTSGKRESSYSLSHRADPPGWGATTWHIIPSASTLVRRTRPSRSFVQTARYNSGSFLSSNSSRTPIGPCST